MIAISVARLARIAGGVVAGEVDSGAVITGPVVFDSRKAEPGSLFVALRGERTDGHLFAEDAIRGGAVAVLAARPVGVPAVVVDDVLLALGRVARHVLDELPGATVVGVTGSSGKTSTKDLLAQVMGRLGPTVAPPSSYNTELGLPVTVLRADSATRYLVLEMAARGVGHIAHLTRVAPPRIGVVLNVGTAHLGEFGSQETIAQAKGELVEALPEDGLAVLNADDRLVRAMASRTWARATLYGAAPDADIRATDVILDESGRARFTLSTPEGSAPTRLRLVGAHYVSNALATATVARAVGMPVDEIADALSEAVPRSRWRMEVHERGDGVTIVNDAYNANPESTRAALRALTTIGRGRRTWAVLGQMAELGAASVQEHEELGRYAARLGVHGILAIGEHARPVAEGAAEDDRPAESDRPTDILVLPDPGSALEALRERLRPGDVVLVKGSLVAGLGPLGEELANEVVTA